MTTTTDYKTKIRDLIRSQQLILVAGTGLSAALAGSNEPFSSWKRLVQNGFDYALERACITEGQRKNWENQLGSDDLDDLLNASQFLIKKLNLRDNNLYSRWLENVFANVKPNNANMEAALAKFSQRGIPIITLNYDDLIEKVTYKSSITLKDKPLIASWMRRESNEILHLHGVWHQPDTCVLGAADYDKLPNDSVRDLVQKAVGSFRHLLFVGCGDTINDPNFSALISWLRTNLEAAAPEHIALVRNCDVSGRRSDPMWRGSVVAAPYGDNYSDLPSFLSDIIDGIPFELDNTCVEKSYSLKAEPESIQIYRDYLIKDCGQMTIEGIRVDMDTAQRKFDLEKLFVPLNVKKIPPELEEDDPDATEKLERWLQKHGQPLPFGEAFATHNRIALLALPGGGKTLLLKRLAVAYADSDRLDQSQDQLPRLKFTPILIRCREWKDYITRPIQSILQSLGKITGLTALHNFFDDLEPLINTGTILLLVDGLDEIHNDGDRTSFVQNLANFVAQYPELKLIVTSREAGFKLIAPSISNFCESYRVSELEDEAIELLCTYWQFLMNGETEASKREAELLAKTLLQNPSLTRLAENPLLLTMLLVVKSGAGRLPPDRVSLYDRAVEVLLDTWNIRGHEALNLKEAVPQLAYVAFEMMKQGKQTATESELLDLLSEGKNSVPHIRRYAKSEPYDFLKRVELRSSLLVEAGHQIERGFPVPFYQFRHLTFQEYLAAVAAANGHYNGYASGHTALTPLEKYIDSEEWKEVIPMAAVLARKNSEPLLRVLIEKASASIKSQLSDTMSLGLPTYYLLQSLVEEADVSPSLIIPALEVLCNAAKGFQSSKSWLSLAKGPYGDEFRQQAWENVRNTKRYYGWYRNTVACILAAQSGYAYGNPISYIHRIIELLKSNDKANILEGILTVSGIVWLEESETIDLDAIKGLLEYIVLHIPSEDELISDMAIWAWSLSHINGVSYDITHVLDVIVSRFLKCSLSSPMGCLAIEVTSDMMRTEWKPHFSEDEIFLLHNMIEEYSQPLFIIEKPYHRVQNSSKSTKFQRINCAVALSYAHGGIMSDEKLLDCMTKIEKNYKSKQYRYDYIIKKILKKMPRKLEAEDI